MNDFNEDQILSSENEVFNSSYIEFANRSLKLLESNIEILNSFFINLKSSMTKFLSIHKNEIFLKYEKNLN